MSLDSLVNKIANAINIKARQAAELKGIKAGRIQGSFVYVDGRSYPFDVAVNVRYITGDWVRVLLADDGTKAVIIGK